MGWVIFLFKSHHYLRSLNVFRSYLKCTIIPILIGKITGYSVLFASWCIFRDMTGKKPNQPLRGKTWPGQICLTKCVKPVFFISWAIHSSPQDAPTILPAKCSSTHPWSKPVCVHSPVLFLVRLLMCPYRAKTTVEFLVTHTRPERTFSMINYIFLNFEPKGKAENSGKVKLWFLRRGERLY